MSEAFDSVTASAASVVISSNSGISPFLTLLIMGLVERNDPGTLHIMDETIEDILTSSIGLGVFGFLTFAHFFLLCIPVVDEVVDGILTFVVPFVSLFGSVATFGLFSNENSDSSDEDEVEDNTDGIATNQTSTASGNNGTDDRKLVLFEKDDTGKLVLQIFLAAFGILLALILHLFEMVLRFFGEACFLAPCLTIMEVLFTILTVYVALVVPEVAIAFAILLILLCVYAGKRLYERRKKRLEEKAERQREIDENGGVDPTRASSAVATPQPHTKEDSPQATASTVTKQHVDPTRAPPALRPLPTDRLIDDLTRAPPAVPPVMPIVKEENEEEKDEFSEFSEPFAPFQEEP